MAQLDAQESSLYADDEFIPVDHDTVIAPDDYVEGYELIGGGQKHKVCGWVDKISTCGNEVILDIQCDDQFGGNRGNFIHGRFGFRLRKERIPRPVLNN